MNFKYNNSVFELIEAKPGEDYDISAESLKEAVKIWNDEKFSNLNLQNIKYASVIANSFVFIFDGQVSGSIYEFAYNNNDPYKFLKKIGEMAHLISDPLFENYLFDQDMYDNLRLAQYSGPDELRFRTGPIVSISVVVNSSNILKYRNIINKDEDTLLELLLQIKRYIRNKEFVSKGLNEEFLRRYKLLSEEDKAKLKELSKDIL